MIKKDSNSFYIEFPDAPAGLYEFKFTRGSGEKYECKKDGDDIGNRSLNVVSDTIFSFFVEAWKDQFVAPIKKHTAGKTAYSLVRRSKYLILEIAA